MIHPSPSHTPSSTTTEERLRRWRLILGGNEADGLNINLSQTDAAIDAALAALYGGGGNLLSGGKAKDRSGNLGASSPNVARWLGDIRNYFPSSVVKIMQADALERLDLKQMLLEPEMLEAVEPDVHLVSTLISLKSVIPNKTKETARLVVRKVADDLERRLAQQMRQAVAGALNRAQRNRRPKHNEIDWHRTIRANLKHFQPPYQTIIPETRIGYGRKKSQLRDIILCVDQSGSMAASVVYSSILAAVLATIPAVRTSLVVFDTSIVDLTEELKDPVDVLFGTQLGGGTDINKALAYCQTLIRQPQDTILILISDLYEGGNRQEMLQRAAAIAGGGTQFIALLALSDDGAPGYDHNVAAHFASLDIPSFACTPDLFPDLMAAAISRQPLTPWLAAHGIGTSKPRE
ncbi:MAG: VWA domain-containing protein [Phycisphaerae bacterium]